MPDAGSTTTFLGWVLGPYGVVILLLTFVFGLHREWWVMGSTYRRSTRREDRLEALVYRATEKIDVFTDVAKDVAQKVK